MPIRRGNKREPTREPNAKSRAAQQQGELTGEQAAIDSQLIELHHHVSALTTELI
jgi:hypothetical protein